MLTNGGKQKVLNNGGSDCAAVASRRGDKATLFLPNAQRGILPSPSSVLLSRPPSPILAVALLPDLGKVLTFLCLYVLI